MGNYVRREYHSQRPAWRNSTNLRGKYVGIEFECVSATQSYRDILNALPDFKFHRGPLVETDGSLPSNSGVELIFPPVSYRQIKNSKSVFAKSLKALEGKISTLATSPGMHININTAGWSVNKSQLFCAVVHNIPNSNLVRLGGRYLNTYCRQTLGNHLSYYDNGYHSVAANKSGRIELRFPKPTTNHEKIKQIVEFAEVVESFANKARASSYYSSTSSIYVDFVKYASKTKKGKLVLGYLNGTNEETKKAASTNPDSSALPAQPISSSVTSSTIDYGSIVTLSDHTGAVLAHHQLGELFTTGSYTVG